MRESAGAKVRTGERGRYRKRERELEWQKERGVEGLERECDRERWRE